MLAAWTDDGARGGASVCATAVRAAAIAAIAVVAVTPGNTVGLLAAFPQAGKLSLRLHARKIFGTAAESAFRETGAIVKRLCGGRQGASGRARCIAQPIGHVELGVDGKQQRQAALEKFGELPQDVLEGTRRSRFAPPLARRGNRPEVPDADASEAGLADGTADAATQDDGGAKA